MKLDSTQRLALRLPSWLGDFVMAEPVLRALAHFYEAVPERLSLVAPAQLLALIDDRFPGVGRVPLGRDRRASYRGHDVAVFLNGSTRSPLQALWAGVPQRIGWSRGGRGPFLTHAICPAHEGGGVPLGLGRAGRAPRAAPKPFGSKCIELASALGIAVPERAPRLVPSEAARARVVERVRAFGLAPDEPLLLLNAGARPDSAKGYGAERWAQVVAGLPELPIVVLCGPGEEREWHALETRSERTLHPLVDPIADLCEAVAWCERATLFLSSDGGPRHLARAVGTPRVVLFGPTDPRHTSECGRAEVALRTQVPCGPCHAERCPLSGPERHQCMARIDVERVAALTRAAWRTATA